MAGRHDLLVTGPIDITNSLREFLKLLDELPGIRLIGCADAVEMDHVVLLGRQSAVLPVGREGQSGNRGRLPETRV